MKTIKLVVMMLAVMMFATGCTKDRSELLIGSWERYAIDYSYSGSPIESHNYSHYMLMSDCDGCSVMKFFFFEDNTGMIIDSGLFGADTTRFTYSVDGRNGVITPTPTEKSSYQVTYSIQDIKKDKMTFHYKSESENYADDGSPYTYVAEVYHYCKKI